MLNKNLFINFLTIYDLNFNKILKIFRVIGISTKINFLKIETNLKTIIIKIIKQNYFYSKFSLKKKKNLKINYFRKIKSFRGYSSLC